MWRKIKKLGLQGAYTNDAETQISQESPGMPYIPAEHIEEQFIRFYRNANGSQVLINLLDYIKSTGIYSDIRPPSACCIFGRSIGTNNGFECWHNRLNRKER